MDDVDHLPRPGFISAYFQEDLLCHLQGRKVWPDLAGAGIWPR